VTSGADRVRRRAERLTACYPRAWRSRYGEEFVELLVDDYTEQPQSWSRTLDVLGSAALARARSAGLVAGSADLQEHVRSSLVALACSLTAFLTVGLAMWSQVVVGWRWEPPSGPVVTVAMVAMSSAALVIAVLAVLAVAPLVWLAVRAIVRRGPHRLGLPAVAALLGGSILVLGSQHFGQAWPGFGGHPWAYQGLVPSRAASLCWGATLAFTAYWAHPAALGSFPAAVLAWMVVSPLATVAFAVGGAKIVRRVELSERVARYELAVANAIVAAMIVFLGGAACWVVNDGSPGPTGIYRVGLIDVAGLILLSLATLSAMAAARGGRAPGTA
jgi:hypothetical protein